MRGQVLPLGLDGQGSKAVKLLVIIVLGKIFVSAGSMKLSSVRILGVRNATHTLEQELVSQRCFLIESRIAKEKEVDS